MKAPSNDLRETNVAHLVARGWNERRRFHLQTRPGTPASTSAPSVSRSATWSRGFRLCLDRGAISAYFSITCIFLCRALASDRASPASRSRPAGGGHHETTRRSWRHSGSMSIARAISDGGAAQATTGRFPMVRNYPPSPRSHRPNSRSAAFSRRSRCSASAYRRGDYGPTRLTVQMMPELSGGSWPTEAG